MNEGGSQSAVNGTILVSVHGRAGRAMRLTH